MIRAVLIDDEKLALLQLERSLKEWGDIEIEATFTNPIQALSELRELRPDVIFLDIDMPGLDGLQTADRIQQTDADAEIVFVTAYDRFAIEAFELNALDYLLKPLDRRRLAKTVDRLREACAETGEETPPPPGIAIRCFGSLRVDTQEASEERVRWRTSKGQELFAYLLHYRKQQVSKERLIELLWPESDPKKASAHLYTTIYQVRRSLKQAQVPAEIRSVSRGDGYMLVLNGIEVDAEAWESDIQRLGPIDESNWAAAVQLLNRYEGDYLGTSGYLWAENERQRLLALWLGKALLVGAFLVHNRKLLQAAVVYRRVLELQPFSEEGHLGMLRTYASMGERSLVISHYRDWADLMKEELGIAPDGKIARWYDAWIHSKV
ncbi:response regulator [Gorillibacterium sp. sgz500922]|uniref:response regulator n=1 Tax=Gorillibacterium sp. sgz500922 TaxID=3446694 RepID=UPI003F6662D4